MKTRVKPRDIEVPANNPFRYDLLNRKESVEALTQLVGNLEGPCVLAIDAPWGNGKTTFFNLWSQHLRDQKVPVVRFNAWETDFSDQPFVALSSELTRGLEAYEDDSIKQKLDETTKVATKLLLRVFPAAVRLGMGVITDGAPLFQTEIGKEIASYAEDRLKAHTEAQQSIEAFRTALEDLAGEVLRRNGHPLIVMIDELDRCRPSYAVELLEIAKHLFSVDGIVFVLAIHRSELVHSIKSIYGADFDARGYLRRFIDVDFKLPEPNRNAFILSLFDALQIGQYFGRNLTRWEHGDNKDAQLLLLNFFAARTLSLRQIQQAMHRLALALASLRDDQKPYAVTTLVALILRTVDAELYHRFCRREVSDKSVMERILPVVSAAAHVRDSKLAHYFEATLILATNELAGISSERVDDSVSPLLQHYRKLAESKPSDDHPPDADQQRAADVIKTVDALNERVIVDGSIGFNDVIQRIEWLSPFFVDSHE